jgi:hypothetical protein
MRPRRRQSPRNATAQRGAATPATPTHTPLSTAAPEVAAGCDLGLV